jgi:pimeloyl-ACP methyl ester carboxylesterase
VTLDLAGHGESGTGRGEWTLDAFAGDVAAVVEALDLARVVLIGHSMGGPVALEAAKRLPGRVIGIVGVDTYQNFEASLTEEQRSHFISRFEADFEAATKVFVRSMFPEGADSALVDHISADMSSSPPEVGIGAMRSLLAYMPQETLGELDVPIYSINSDRFPTNVEANKRIARDYHVKFMPGRGHFVQLEDPDGFNRLLEEVIGEMVSR